MKISNHSNSIEMPPLSSSHTSFPTSTSLSNAFSDKPLNNKQSSFSSNGSTQVPPISSSSISSPPVSSFCKLFLKQLISPYATPLFQLKDISLRAKYQEYNAKQEVSLYPIAISIIMFSALPLFVGMAIQSQDSIPDLVLCSLLALSVAAVATCGILVGYFHYRIDWANACLSDSSNIKLSDLQNKRLKEIIQNSQWWLNKIGYLFMLSFEAVVILYALRRGHSRVCVNPNDERHHQYLPPDFQNIINIFFCGSDIGIVEDSHVLPVDAMYLLAVAPLVVAIIFPSLDVMFLWIQILLCLIIFIFVSTDNHGHLHPHVPSATTIIAWASSNVFIIAELQLDKINRFYMHLQLVDLIEENQRNAEAFHVNEMRFLIANVAHDLKTVSECYMWIMCDQLPCSFFFFTLAVDVIYFRDNIDQSICRRIFN